MKPIIFLTVISNLWFIEPTQAAATTSKSHITIVSTAERANPKVLKRSTASPLLSPLIQPKVLNKKPVNILQNGPYFINHYIYCDNIDKDILEQIKSGTLSSQKAIELLNFKDKFHGFYSLETSLGSNGVYTGDKEIHILDLPKTKPHNFEGEGLNSHFPETTDLELNQHFDHFDIDLKGTNQPEIHFSSEFPKPIGSDTVRPLIQGQIQGFQNQKFNPNLDQIVHYLKGDADTDLDQPGDVVINPNGEHLELPHLEKHPLEHDPLKSSYDTPGAVDSYGEPVTRNSLHHDSLHYLHPPSNSHQGSFGISKGHLDTYPENDAFIKHFNEINGFNRRRRQDFKKKKVPDDIRHPNHKYD